MTLGVHCFMEEDTTFIDESYMLDFLNKQDPNGLLNLIRDIHFHPDRPENHNICVSNFNKKKIYCMTYIGIREYEGKRARAFLRRYIEILRHIIKRNYWNFSSLKTPNKAWDDYIDEITADLDFEAKDLKPYFELLYKYKFKKNSVNLIM
jgi:hypothetical protein